MRALALLLVAAPSAAEVTLTWELPTRLEYCVDSGPVLDTLVGTRVYPHACGETSRAHRRHELPGGLSPRMRGNQT